MLFTKVPSAPSQDDTIVLLLPVIVLHLRLIDQVNLREPHSKIFQLLDCYGTLVEAVDLLESMNEDIFAHLAIAGRHHDGTTIGDMIKLI